MEITNSHGKMSNACGCTFCCGTSGKEITENQHKKRIGKHCHSREMDFLKKSRWNKKNGTREMSRKGSYINRYI